MEEEMIDLIDFRELKIDYLKFLAEHKTIQPILDYDAYVDMIMVLYAPANQEVIAHYIDDYFGVLYYKSNLEIIGFQIENFVIGMLPKYPNIQAVWHGKMTEEILREILNAVSGDLGDYRETFVALVA